MENSTCVINSIDDLKKINDNCKMSKYSYDNSQVIKKLKETVNDSIKVIQDLRLQLQNTYTKESYEKLKNMCTITEEKYNNLKLEYDKLKLDFELLEKKYETELLDQNKGITMLKNEFTQIIEKINQQFSGITGDQPVNTMNFDILENINVKKVNEILEQIVRIFNMTFEQSFQKLIDNYHKEIDNCRNSVMDQITVLTNERNQYLDEIISTEEELKTFRKQLVDALTICDLHEASLSKYSDMVIELRALLNMNDENVEIETLMERVNSIINDNNKYILMLKQSNDELKDKTAECEEYKLLVKESKEKLENNQKQTQKLGETIADYKKAITECEEKLALQQKLIMEISEPLIAEVSQSTILLKARLEKLEQTCNIKRDSFENSVSRIQKTNKCDDDDCYIKCNCGSLDNTTSIGFLHKFLNIFKKSKAIDHNDNFSSSNDSQLSKNIDEFIIGIKRENAIDESNNVWGQNDILKVQKIQNDNSDKAYTTNTYKAVDENENNIHDNEAIDAPNINVTIDKENICYRNIDQACNSPLADSSDTAIDDVDPINVIVKDNETSADSGLENVDLNPLKNESENEVEIINKKLAKPIVKKKTGSKQTETHKKSKKKEPKVVDKVSIEHQQKNQSAKTETKSQNQKISKRTRPDFL